MTDTDTAANSIRSWLGIPYATAERFRRPVLLPFNPDRPYDQNGPAPLQAGDTSWLEADNGLSEDCLNLNVWAPKDAGEEPLPVIVYIFGGGFEVGANTQTTSNASSLAATGRAIGVSLNYRLGPFGWLSLSQYGGVFADATNIGLQDIITALQWAQANIAHFGGDPQNVTVTGHSAGAYSTIGLLAAPAADGLYRRLAAFSGGASRIVPAWWAEELAISSSPNSVSRTIPNVCSLWMRSSLLRCSSRSVRATSATDTASITRLSALWTTTLRPGPSSPTRRCAS